MFDRKARQRLENLRATLLNWEQSVPERAKGFHRLRKLLLDDIDTELKRPFASQSLAERYEQRYQPLHSLSFALAELLGQTQQLEAELDETQTLFQQDRQAAPYGEQCCKQWRDELRQLVAHCEREADIYRAKHSLEEIEHSLRVHAEALRALHQADATLREFGAGPETASLEAELERVRLSLAQGRVALDSAQRLRQLSAPVAERLRQPVPQELNNLSVVLAEIRRWDRVLDWPADAERALEQRHRQLGLDWRRRDAAELQALLAEAEALREQRIKQGRAAREAKWRELDELFDDLTHACGPKPDIRERLDALKAGVCDSANRYADWLETYKEAEVFFNAMASNEEMALENRLRERQASLKARFGELWSLPLAEDLRRDAEDLEQQAAQAGLPQGTQSLLKALRQNNRFQRQLEDFIEQAGQDIAALYADKERLAEAHRQLRRQAARVGFALDDIAADIDALGVEGTGQTLDQARQQSALQAQRVDGIRQDFLRRCEAEHASLWAAIQARQQALREAGLNPNAVAAQEAPADAAAFADRLLALREAQARLDTDIGAALDGLQQTRSAQQAQLAGLDLAALNPGERQEAQMLLTQWQAAPQDADPLRRLQEWAGIAEACADFLTRLSLERQDLERQADALFQRLLDFNRDGLRPYCPEEWFCRASDLAYGLPRPPQPAHAAQLQAATSLLGRLETQARRRLAQEIDGQVAELDRHKRGHPRPEAVDMLLGKLRSLEAANQPVPLNLRLKLKASLGEALAGSLHG